jgi:ribonuclease BN (tRNA processing enzyme)
MVKQSDRTPSGYLIEGEDTKIILDTGTGITGNIPGAGLEVADLDAVINTHRHPDHVSDLIPIVQDKIVRSGSQEETDIILYGPEGHRDYVDMRLSEEVPVSLDDFEEEFGFDLEVREIDGKVKIPGGTMDSIEAEHGPEQFTCLSLRLSIDDREILFTGDTDYHEELVEFSRDADILVTDCSKPHHLKSEGHMTGKESGKLARKADVDTLVLSHLYPEADEHGVRDEAEEEFSGEVIVAEDLKQITPGSP